MLSSGQQQLQPEKEAIVEAGLSSSPWQHIDDTGTPVNGRNWHCQVLCNPLYTAYTTTIRKNRLTVIDVLRNQRGRIFRLIKEAFGLMRQFKVSQRVLDQLRQMPSGQEWRDGVQPTTGGSYSGSGGGCARRDSGSGGDGTSGTRWYACWCVMMPNRIPGKILGLLQRTARLPAGHHARADGSIARSIRRPILDRDRLPCSGSAHRQNQDRQGAPLDGAEASRDSVAQ